MHFYLNEKTFFVPGAKRGAIYDLENKDIYYLDDKETRLLIKSEAGKSVHHDDMDFYKELETEGVGFFCERPSYIEKTRLYAPYLMKRRDLNPMKVGRVYIKLNDVCGGECSQCNKYFCPMCYADNDVQCLAADRWLTFLEELMYLGLREVIFTGGEAIDYKDIIQLINYCREKSVKVSLVLSGSKPLPTEFPRVDRVIMMALEARDYGEILDSLEAYNEITVLYGDANVYGQMKQLTSISLNGGCIDKRNTSIKSIDDFYGLDVKGFYQRKDFDTCLFGKLFVDHKGNIVPCYQGSSTVLANISEDLYDRYEKLLREYWYQPCCESKCGDCELYYSCSICRYGDRLKDCDYDPYVGEFI